MSTVTEPPCPSLETLAAIIARSPIRVPHPRTLRRLPAGFDEADVAILEWIAAEGRRVGGRLLQM